jgi:hypothetical protein
MLGKYIKINNQDMPNPVPGTFEMQYNPDENVFTNEAGGQMSNVRRLDRVSWTATFQCTSATKDKILNYCKAPYVSTTINNTTYSGRLRLSGTVALYENSEYTAGTDGLWTVPVIFEGF